MELFVSFSEFMHFFRKNRIKFAVTVLAFGVLFGLLPLKLVHHTYSGSTTIIVSYGVQEQSDSDYRLQYTNILYSRMQTVIAIASGNDLLEKTAAKVGIEKSEISKITAEQVNSAPVIKLTASTTNAAKAAAISDTAAQILADELTQQFPSPKLNAAISDKSVPAKAESKKSSMMKAGILGLAFGFIVYVCYGIIAVLSDRTVRNSRFVEETMKTRLLCEIPAKPEKDREDFFRKLRAAAIHQAGTAKSFLVADVCGDDGGAGVAAGFAGALAQSGKRVLLIDANLHSPKIAGLLCVTPEKTMADVLSGSCTLEKAAVSSAAGMAFLAGGQAGGQNPADIFAGEAFAKMMAGAAGMFDSIVLYAPPEIRFPDTENLAALFQAVILTVKYGSTRYENVRESFDRIPAAGGKIIGFVTTGA
jgi:polysaccharide biosynthesis transport protein